MTDSDQAFRDRLERIILSRMAMDTSGDDKYKILSRTLCDLFTDWGLDEMAARSDELVKDAQWRKWCADNLED